MKKLFALLTCLFMLSVSFLFPLKVLASPGTIGISHIPHSRTYTIDPGFFAEEVLYPSEYEGIYQTLNQDYFAQVDEVTFVRTNYLDFQLNNPDLVLEQLEEAELPEAIALSIFSEAQTAFERGDTAAYARHFIIELNPPEETPITPIDPGAVSPNETIEITYQGHPMRSDKTFYYNLSTGWGYAVHGTASRSRANAITNLILSAVSTVSTPIVSTGITLFQAFVDLYGSTPLTGHTDDYLQVKLEYNKVEQYTYGKMSANDSWRLGLHSQSVTVKKIFVEEYFCTNGVGHTLNKSYSKNLNKVTQHYDSPWATAWSSINNPMVETVSWKVYGTYVSF